MKRIKKKQTKRRRSRIRSVRKCNISKMRSAFTRFTLFQQFVETDMMGGIGRYMKVIFGLQKLMGSFYWERTDLIPRGYWKFGSLPCTSKMCCWNVFNHCGFQSDHWHTNQCACAYWRIIGWTSSWIDLVVTYKNKAKIQAIILFSLIW